MPLPIGLRRRTTSDEDTDRFDLRSTGIARRRVLAIVGVGLGALAALAVTARYEPSLEVLSVNWTVFGLITALLIGCEVTPVSWIRIGPHTTVTPLWLFALALLLVGSPSISIAIAIVGALAHALTRGLGPLETVERITATGLSLAAGALALRALGVESSIIENDHIPISWALGIVCAGLAIVVSNAIVATLIATIQRGRAVGAVFRRNLATRITAEGALLSLAPIWVVSIDFSPVLVPLLGVTTVLVFRSTREALERSHEAQHDSLTGLANRRSFLEELDETIAALPASPNRSASVLLLDLDGFKEVNDHLGHAVGDSLLIALAERLIRILPPSATVARLGGDEFAALLTGIPDRVDVELLVDRLHAQLAAPLSVDGFPISIGVSVGAAICPEDGSNQAELLSSADVAMYRSKRGRRAAGGPSGESKFPKRSRVALLGDIGTALDHGELYVNYQPQVRMIDGTADTVEALIRWHHPQHGSIPPQEFIGLAEQTDLIAPITRVVLQQAARGLLATGIGDVRLAVNVTPRSLIDRRFARSVFEVLEETRFPAERLELEITERALVTNPERSAATIGRLRSAGIRIALDDFGTGYSSYQTLRMIQVDRVKIDQAFVTGITRNHRDRAIVHSLIALAHELGFDVVGEGVEDEALYSALRALGCDLAQGYFIALPMSVHEIGGWLRSVNGAGERNPLRLVY